MSKIGVVLAGMVLLVSSGALAQQQQRPQPTPLQVQVVESCGADAERFCPGVQPGQGRIKACLEPHLHQLSRQCKNAILEAALGSR